MKKNYTPPMASAEEFIMPPTPEEEEALLYARNADWADKIPAIIADKSTLFVVGAAHLPGERGVLELLRAKGYVVEPLMIFR